MSTTGGSAAAVGGRTAVTAVARDPERGTTMSSAPRFTANVGPCATPPEASTTILVVEDSPTQALQLTELLDAHAYRVVVARNGQEALAVLAEELPDIVLSDVVMPLMDGYELCRRVKADPRLAGVPVLLVTSLSDPGDVIRALECGADDFIVKPYVEVNLLARVRFNLVNRQLHAVDRPEMGVEVFFAGRRHFIGSSRLQILNLLLSTYETAVLRNLDLERVRAELEATNESLDERVRERSAALVASQERFREFIENAQIGVYQTTADGTIVMANPRMATMFGFSSPEELMRENLEDWAARNLIDRAHFRSLLERDGLVSGFESSQTRPDGTVIYIREHARAIRDEAGRTLFYEGTIEDLTEQKALEAQLRHAQKMEAVGNLAGGVAHDVNNLLQAMLSQIQLLHLRQNDRDTVADVAGELEAQVKRGAGLTRQLLLFSRRETTRFEPLDLNDIVADTLKMLRRLVRENVAFEVELVDERLPVEGDRGQLEQVLTNLVVNASNAMPDGGKLSIRTRRQPPASACLMVEDTGHGIPAAIRQRIFEPFFTTRAAEHGTGLGLAVVHGIVTQHGGRIEVDSAVGRGSTFSIALPLTAVPAAAATLDAGTAQPTLVRGAGERVLVVEDKTGPRQPTRHPRQPRLRRDRSRQQHRGRAPPTAARHSTSC